VRKYQEELRQKGTHLVVDYRVNKGHTRKRLLVKLTLCRAGDRIMALIVPPTCVLSGKRIYDFYRQRFTIETYYRQMHRFQIFSCSQHPAVRFIIVLLAFWLCNFWAYFKAHFVYTANDFCEFIRTSWHRALFKGLVVFSKG
jgi:hypothetical protein